MPFYQYSISRYVENIMRDEPINIGVLINKPNTNEYVGKFIPNIDLIHKIHHNANLLPLKIVLETFKGEHKSNATLKDISGKSDSKLQFTEPAPIEAKDPSSAVHELYEDFISIVENFPSRISTGNAHTTTRKIFLRTVELGIKQWNLPKKCYATKHVEHHKKRKITFDYVFKNNKIRDAINVVPISATDPKSSRDAASSLASDYKRIKNELDGDMEFHTVIQNLGTGDNNKHYFDLAKEDLDEVGCDTLEHSGITPCLAKIRTRLH